MATDRKRCFAALTGSSCWDDLGDNDDFRRLKQIPGIGPILALTILAETGDLRRFHHHRQFLKFCGLDLATQ